MNSEYKKLYEEQISNKCRMIIIEYSPQCKTYKYYPFSHSQSVAALDELMNLIIDNVVFYAFLEDEIIRLDKEIGLLEDLRLAAKYAFSQRLPKRNNPNSDGTLGEVLLDLLLQVYEPSSKKLVARAKYIEVGKRSNEITGYDALYFTQNNGKVFLWFGQAKAGKKQYCKDGIIKDLNTTFDADYFSDTLFYIADKCDSNELSELLTAINRICFQAQKNKWNKEIKLKHLSNLLKDKGVQVRIPCLLAFSKDIYSSGKLTENINNVTNKKIKKFDNQSFSINFDLPYEILFYIFPIKDISYIRSKIVEFKKEVV